MVKPIRNKDGNTEKVNPSNRRSEGTDWRGKQHEKEIGTEGAKSIKIKLLIMVDPCSMASGEERPCERRTCMHPCTKRILCSVGENCD